MLSQQLVDHDKINWSRFESFLRSHFENIPEGEMEVEKFTEGYSNQTYLIKIGEWEGVMRRPPFGEIPPRAHDMEREYKILKEISAWYDLAPKPYVYEEDSTIMDKHFYVMERIRGIVIDEKLPADFQDSITYGPIISKAFVGALVKLHGISCSQGNLLSIGKPEGYLERQVHGWIKRFHKARTDNVQTSNDLENWLVANIPTTTETTIVHNDFKLNNLIFKENQINEIIGVIDWELATIGDPMTDLGSSIVYWMEPGDPDLGVTAVTNQAGFLTRREFAEAYARTSGRDLSDINYYVTFGFYKLAGILQQIYQRWYNGSLNDPRFEKLYVAVNNLLEMAESARMNRIL